MQFNENISSCNEAMLYTIYENMNTTNRLLIQDDQIFNKSLKLIIVLSERIEELSYQNDMNNLIICILLLILFVMMLKKFSSIVKVPCVFSSHNLKPVDNKIVV